MAGFLKGVDTKIPDNQDIQNWIDQAESKGAIKGDDDSDDDDDDDDDHDADDDTDHDHDGHHGHPDHHQPDYDDDDDDHDNWKHQGKVAEPSPSAWSMPQSTSTGLESVDVIASRIPSPSKNVESPTSTVYVPVTVLPSENRVETPAPSPTVFSLPDTVPMVATPTSAPVMYKVITD